MAPRSSTSIISLPHYILALVLAKSKPANKSTREWLRLLGSFVKVGPRPKERRGAMNYIDKAAMWHEAYKQSEEAQLVLRARNLELEKLLEKLTGDTDPLALTSPKKRRRRALEPSEASGTRIQKKPRLLASAKAAASYDTILEDDIENSERPETGSLGNPIISHLFILQQTLAQRRFEPSDLAATLSQTAKSVCRYLRDLQLIQKPEIATADVGGIEVTIARGENAAQSHEKEDETTAKLFAVGQIFPKLLAGLDRLTHSPGGQLLEEQVVYDYIQIFQGLLQRICDVATARKKERQTEPQELPNRDPRNSQAQSTQTRCSTCRDRNLKCDTRMPKCRSCSRLKRVCQNRTPASTAHTTVRTPVKLSSGNQIIKLCELEIAMLGCLSIGNQAHAKVLQGFLCILCGKVGHSLRRFMFGSERDGLPEESNGNEPSINHDWREDDEAIEAQGPYLVWILERAETVLSRHNLSEDSNQPLSNTRKRLQNTLLKSVFGQEASIAFEPSLQTSRTLTDADIAGWTLPPVESKNWFKHEVWRIVGWDVLSNHIQWD